VECPSRISPCDDPPGLFRRPLSIEVAFDLVASWLDQPSAMVVHPGPRHLRVVWDLLRPLNAGGNLRSDAHLAALAIEHGPELCSSDSDFRKCEGFKWSNPIS
jgi:predicted nucleic acid-binding protein